MTPLKVGSNSSYTSIPRTTEDFDFITLLTLFFRFKGRKTVIALGDLFPFRNKVRILGFSMISMEAETMGQSRKRILSVLGDHEPRIFL